MRLHINVTEYFWGIPLFLFWVGKPHESRDLYVEGTQYAISEPL